MLYLLVENDVLRIRILSVYKKTKYAFPQIYVQHAFVYALITNRKNSKIYKQISLL